MEQTSKPHYKVHTRVSKSVKRRQSSRVRSVLGTGSAHTSTHRMSDDLGKVVHVNEVKDA